MRTTKRLFAACLKRYRHQTPWRFCWQIALEGVIISALVLVPLIALGASTRDAPQSLDDFFISSVFLAPWLETLIFQSIPIGICRSLGLSTGVQAIASITPFFLTHLTLGVAPGVAAGLIGGFYLAFTYIRWRRRDWWTAFWVTSASHAIRNGIAVFLALAGL